MKLLLSITMFVIGMALYSEVPVPVYEMDLSKSTGKNIYDLSSLKNKGVLRGKTEIKGENGRKYIKFPGESNSFGIITPKPGARIGNEATVSFWFRCNKLPVEKKAGMFTLFSYNWNYRFRIKNNGSLQVAFVTESKELVINAKTFIQPHRWYHAAYTYSLRKGEANVYINGKRIFSQNKNIASIRKEGKSPYLLGASPGNVLLFNGDMKDVKIFDKALVEKDLDVVEAKRMRKEVTIFKEKASEFTGFVKKCEKVLGQKKISIQDFVKIQNAFFTIIYSKDKDLATYIVKPIDKNPILPNTQLKKQQLGNKICITAAKGEYEPGSFVVRSSSEIKNLLPVPTTLKTEKGSVIPKENIDIKLVKCHYQSGNAWIQITQNKYSRVLVPELLLNDDSLVKVDFDKQENYLKLSFPFGDKYVWNSDPKENKRFRHFLMSPEQYPVRDSKQLLPVNVRADFNQQFWITVKVPENAEAGVYHGKINLNCDRIKGNEINLTVNVLPFKLPMPKTNHNPEMDFESSIYYISELDPSPGGKGSLTPWKKSEEQYLAELKNLIAHNAISPISIHPVYYRNADKKAKESERLATFKRIVALRKKAGIKDNPFYFSGCNLRYTSKILKEEPGAIERLKEDVRKNIKLIESEYGHRNVYFYGFDEAKGDKLRKERIIWKEIKKAGGKCFAAGYSDGIKIIGDLQDLLVAAFSPQLSMASKMHANGNKIWSYGNPQGGVENPEVYRRNFGLTLYLSNYDGAATYCYYDSFGDPWNDFDHPDYRDHNFVYPTVDGVINTIAWEGYREAIDDIRYISLLRLRIKKVLTGNDLVKKKLALDAKKWLKNIEPDKRDLDTLRMEIIKRILELQ